MTSPSEFQAVLQNPNQCLIEAGGKNKIVRQGRHDKLATTDALILRESSCRVLNPSKSTGPSGEIEVSHGENCSNISGGKVHRAGIYVTRIPRRLDYRRRRGQVAHSSDGRIKRQSQAKPGSHRNQERPSWMRKIIVGRTGELSG